MKLLNNYKASNGIRSPWFLIYLLDFNFLQTSTFFIWKGVVAIGKYEEKNDY